MTLQTELFLEISQNSQENTCARVSFLIDSCNFIKKETLAEVFSYEICKIFKNTFFTEHLWTTASATWFCKLISVISKLKFCFIQITWKANLEIMKHSCQLSRIDWEAPGFGHQLTKLSPHRSNELPEISRNHKFITSRILKS